MFPISLKGFYGKRSAVDTKSANTGIFPTSFFVLFFQQGRHLPFPDRSPMAPMLRRLAPLVVIAGVKNVVTD